MIIVLITSCMIWTPALIILSNHSVIVLVRHSVDSERVIGHSVTVCRCVSNPGVLPNLGPLSPPQDDETFTYDPSDVLGRRSASRSVSFDSEISAFDHRDSGHLEPSPLATPTSPISPTSSLHKILRRSDALAPSAAEMIQRKVLTAPLRSAVRRCVLYNHEWLFVYRATVEMIWVS